MNTTRDTEALPAGTELLFGTYKILSLLERSDESIVYLAEDKVGQQTLIKESFPLGQCYRDGMDVKPMDGVDPIVLEKSMARLSREAKHLALVEHDNVVSVFQVFNENNTSYLSMKHVPGAAVRTVIDTGISMPPEDVQSCLQKLLGAVSHVHEHGLIHRDIRPENIIMAAGTGPVLIGFGSAIEANDPAAVLEGIESPSEHFAPPEFFASGERHTAQSDIYSVAATLYNVVSGRAPVNSAYRLEQVNNDRRDPLKSLTKMGLPHNPKLLESIEQAMSLDPAERPETAAEWSKRVKQIGAESVAAAAASDVPPAHVAEQAKPSGGLKYVVSGAVLAAAIGAVAIGYTTRSSGDIDETIAQREKALATQLEQELQAKLSEKEKEFQAQRAELQQVTEQRAAELAAKEAKLAAELELIQEAAATQEQVTAEREAELNDVLAEQKAALEAKQREAEKAEQERLRQFAAERAALEAELAEAAAAVEQREAEARQREEELAKKLADAQKERELLEREAKEREAALAQNQDSIATQLAQAEKSAAQIEEEAKRREAEFARRFEEQQAAIKAQQEELERAKKEREIALAEQQKAVNQQLEAIAEKEEETIAREAAMAEKLQQQQAEIEAQQARLEAAIAERNEAVVAQEAAAAAEKAAREAAEQERIALQKQMEENLQAQKALQEKAGTQVADASTLGSDKDLIVERLAAVKPGSASVPPLPLDQQIADESWTVEVPFGLALAIGQKGQLLYKVSRVNQEVAPGWIENGLEIHQVNGAPVKRRTELAKMLQDAAVRDQAVSLTVRRPGQRRLENRLVMLDKTGRITLQNGTAFNILVTDRGWAAEVVEAAGQNEDRLRVGDRVRLDNPNALKALIGDAVDAKVAAVALSADREGNPVKARIVLKTSNK